MARYINENILKMRIRENFRTQFDWNDVIDADDLKIVLEQIPTADVQEVKHGTWKEENFEDDVVYTCSVCGEAFCTIEGTPADNLWNYCPTCGARMDGEAK